MYLSIYVKSKKAVIMKENTLKILESEKLIAVMSGFSTDTLLYSVEALIRGGIKAVMITPESYDEAGEKDLIIKVGGIKKCFGTDLAVGAARVFCERTVKLVKGVGGDFISTLGINSAVLGRAAAVGLVTIPCAYTANEISSAFSLGGDYVCLFPTKVGGSTEYAEIMSSAFYDKKIFTSSGITLSDIPRLKSAGIHRFCTDAIANETLAEKKAYDVITNMAKKYVETCQK